jgi:hypothetical protein
MPVQVRTDVTVRNYSLGRPMKSRDSLTVEQDAGRGAVDIEKFTVMAWNAARTKLIPLTDNTATDGTQIPVGLMGHKVNAADIVAGDVEDCVMYTWAESANESLIVLENSLTLEDTFQIASVTPLCAEVTTVNASDLSTAIALVNDIKVKLNAVSTAGETSIIKTIRDHLENIGIGIRRGENQSRVENS